jgi:hypothetical protein
MFCTYQLKGIIVTARLLYFPSLHGRDPKPVKAFKFVFEVIAKLLVNWWALGLIWMGQKNSPDLAGKNRQATT